MNLNDRFNNQTFNDWVEQFLPGFSRDVRKVDIPRSFPGVKSIHTLGESSLGVRVYTIEMETDPSKRKIGLATDSFSLLRNYGTPNAIVVYYSEDSSHWRLSLLTSTPIWNEGKIITKLSNPKRQSYVLGPKAKVKTPHQYLISKGSVADFADLKSRFSLEVVNKEFYKEISNAYIRLVGGTLANGRSKQTFKPILRLPFVIENSQTSMEFAVRLIGRIIFCWFLREKRSPSGNTLMPRELLSSEASNKTEDYYHRILEPIFFEILNKPTKSRKEAFGNELFSAIPYLNGGLFSPHEDDFYNYNEGKQAVNHNMVIVPDEWLRSLFEVLETYNFTIDENTSFDEELSIDPEMLGRIFENLLAEINPETGESARKSTGSYYTPRVIVDYMVDESLKLYLKTKTRVSEEKLKALISYDLEDDETNPLNSEEKDNIAEALGKIKILDPACGSGAFPIGALQKIVFILQQIDENGQLWFKKQIQNTPVELRRVIEREFQEKNFDYIRKLGIIRENIYGIDIQPIATEISRLRCFLTLVVDERVDDTLENRGIEPLPNLDFKFVTANSLIGLPKFNLAQQELFDDNSKIEQLKSLRNQYFTARSEERKDVMLAFSDLQSEMINDLIDKHSFTGVLKAELTRKLTDWKPFKHKSTDWFDPEWMFGIKDGFNIVIANPPYVQIQKLKQEEKDNLKKQNYITFSKTADLYCLFYERSFNLLQENGILTYISSNKFFRAGYGKPLRTLLSSKVEIQTIIDFCELPVFSAGTDPCVLVILNKLPNNSKIRAAVIKNASEIQNINSTLTKIGLDLDRSALGFDGWTIEGSKGLELIKKIKSVGIPLVTYVSNRFYRGILTGFNEAFVINSTIKNQLIHDDAHSEKVIQPWLRGQDILRWKSDYQDLYIINIQSSTNCNWPWTGKKLSEAEEIFKKVLPAIYNHLSKFKSNLKSRDDQGQYYWELRACKYNNAFAENKIVYNETSKELHAFYDEGKLIINKTGFIILCENAKFLLGILNSRLMDFYYRSTFPSWGDPWKDGRIQFRGDRIEKLPIPTVVPTDFKKMAIKTKIENFVNEIINLIKLDNIDIDEQNSIKQIERQIDLLVYDLYGIEKKEIELIESFYN